MKIRTVVFWAHLVAGVAASLVILMMSVTGVLLTYERQIIAWVENGYVEQQAKGAEPLLPSELLAAIKTAVPDAENLTLTFSSDPQAALRVSAGRNREWLLDPYSGAVLLEGKTSVESFFRTVMYVHRWFALTGDSRATGRAITGYSNLLFLFLLCTGIYLWLPSVWSRVALKSKVFFNPKATSGKARDYNWHHVFSFWTFIPLFFVITTASVFYFPWANTLVYAAFGEEPPERRGGGAGQPLPSTATPRTYEELLHGAISEAEKQGVEDWQSIAMEVSAAPEALTRFRIDRTLGGQPAHVYRLALDTADGQPREWRTFADNSPGSRARSTIRFLHTGEVLGLAGQTIAGLASLAACFLVWTGLALAWRRLVRPLFLGVADAA